MLSLIADVFQYSRYMRQPVPATTKRVCRERLGLLVSFTSSNSNQYFSLTTIQVQQRYEPQDVRAIPRSHTVILEICLQFNYGSLTRRV